MPNITGNFADVPRASSSVDGCFYFTNGATSGTGYYDGGGGDAYVVNFDASRSSAIYGASDTVQPASLNLIPQIKY